MPLHLQPLVRYMEAAMRVELMNNGFADRCLSHLAMPPIYLERANGFEPSTSTLARWHSTTELRPLRFTARTITNKNNLSTGKLPFVRVIIEFEHIIYSRVNGEPQGNVKNDHSDHMGIGSEEGIMDY